MTQRIVEDLQKGVRPWHQPWAGGDKGIPTRHNGLAYRGINIILLWVEAVRRGYGSSIWMTYNQAKREGGQVRKGQRGSMVVFARSFDVTEANDRGEAVEKRIYLLRRYTVFNVEQIDNLPENFSPKPIEPLSPDKRIANADAFVKATAATIRHAGGEAYYAQAKDYIQMPAFERFEDPESYYATILHELTHWTRHENRLNRDFGQKRWGDAAYAIEELVAEIGAAFLCAEIGITPTIRADHAAYIGDWLTILKNDSRAIFRAAAHAQKAAEYLKRLQPNASPEIAENEDEAEPGLHAEPTRPVHSADDPECLVAKATP